MSTQHALPGNQRSATSAAVYYFAEVVRVDERYFQCDPG